MDKQENKESLRNETPIAMGVVNQETDDPLIQEVKRRTKLFIEDNYSELQPSEHLAVSLIIENAMLIGGSIILEQTLSREWNPRAENTCGRTERTEVRRNSHD